MAKVQACQFVEAKGKETVKDGNGVTREDQTTSKIRVCEEGIDAAQAQQNLSKLLQQKGGGNGCGLVQAKQFRNKFQCESVEKKGEVVTFQKAPPLQKNVFVHVWASWCPNCIPELPHIIASAERLKKLGVQVVIVTDHDDKYADINLRYKRAGGKDVPLINLSEADKKKIGGIPSYPTSVLMIDGRIVQKNGLMSEGQLTALEQKASALLNDKKKR